MGSTNYKKLCPADWHVPSDAELATLANFLGGGVAGGKMKTIGTTYWNSPNTGATNESGFSALPSGFRGYGTFFIIGDHVIIWSDKEGSNNSRS
jgi:uncharacterized protein (TIGR02145 family)